MGSRTGNNPSNCVAGETIRYGASCACAVAGRCLQPTIVSVAPCLLQLSILEEQSCELTMEHESKAMKAAFPSQVTMLD